MRASSVMAVAGVLTIAHPRQACENFHGQAEKLRWSFSASFCHSDETVRAL
jgi:hypothetical protein